MNFNLAAVYCNKDKLNLFWINDNVTISNLKSQLNGILNQSHPRMVVIVKYRGASVDSNGHV